jgi:multiple RNA-binding domain-containing protein 1
VFIQLLTIPQIEDRKVLEPVNNRENETGETNAPAKRKATEAESTAVNPKLREYLEVMQPPSKSKTWANEDHAIPGTKGAEAEKSLEMMPEDGPSDDEYVRIVKKRKMSPVAPPIPEKALSKEEPLVGSGTNIAENEGGVASDVLKAVEASTSPLVGQVTSSDSDWLRSHTSRLLGLVDNDDDIVSSRGPELESDPVPEAEAEVHIEVPKQTSAAGSRIEEEPSKQDKNEVATDGDININPTSTGRLFLRNLSYVVNSNELRDQFSKYGVLTEVSRAVYIILVLSRFCDEHPDRDILCFAHDALWISILVDTRSSESSAWLSVSNQDICTGVIDC